MLAYLYTKVQPQKLAVQGHNRVHKGKPGIEMLREAGQRLRAGGQKRNNRLVEANPDGKLDHHGTKATQGVYPRLLVEAHGLLLHPPAVLGIFSLDLPQLRLELRHPLGGAHLPFGKRSGGQPHQDREHDDGQPEVVQQQRVEDHQTVHHRVQDQRVPDDLDELHDYPRTIDWPPAASHCCSPGSAPAPTRGPWCSQRRCSPSA